MHMELHSQLKIIQETYQFTYPSLPYPLIHGVEIFSLLNGCFKTCFLLPQISGDVVLRVQYLEHKVSEVILAVIMWFLCIGTDLL